MLVSGISRPRTRLVVAGLATAAVYVAAAKGWARARAFSNALADAKLAEQRFRSLFETAPDGRVLLDADGRIVLANSETERLFGYRREELIGVALDELVPSGAGATWQWVQVAADGGTVPALLAEALDLRARRKDGSEFPIEISLGELPSADGRLVAAVLRDVTERKLAAEALSHQATHDPLTGLPNRTLFLDRLEHALARARRSEGKLAVVFLDLDRFKAINDTRGHAAGDSLLAAIAPRLGAALRPGDTIARIGGDEFVVLCEDLGSIEDAGAIARRVVEACAIPVAVDGYQGVVTVSAGVVVIEDPDAASPSEILRDADAAMYRAKSRGSGHVELFDAGMRTGLRERTVLEGELRQALERGELRLVYQPVVSLAKTEVIGVEALLRWQHPERGLLEPAAFLQVAQDSGLIVPIGAWAIENACRQLRDWRRARPEIPQLDVAVNLSAPQLADPELAAGVSKTLRETGLEPDRLSLEIVERTLVEEERTAARALRELQAVGVRLVLDGFGPRYSPLRDLKRFAIDAIKLDRSLVDGLGREGEDGAVIDALLRMAGALHVDVTAVGVESLEQLARLRSGGCEFAQGFLFSPPLAPERLIELLGDPGLARRLGAVDRREALSPKETVD
jgi:diguanylate cyclase (GGDEF)-like protein/PAS domain S-box-containing protein